MTLYNDNDPKVCVWLRELIASEHLPLGPVFERPIEDLTNDDLDPYDTFHAFAGIGGWALALKLAGWPAERPVWTASCPCQPFSVAGARLGSVDKRHLWPEFARLVELRRPPTIFGEQVASRAGREWLAGVRADLEALGYAVGAADLCAAGEGAPHIRQRLYWVANTTGARLQGNARGAVPRKWGASVEFAYNRSNERLDNPASTRRDEARSGESRESERGECVPRDGRDAGGMALSNGGHSSAEREQRGGQQRQQPENSGAGAWSSSQLHACRDGKHRRIPLEPAFFPLVNGVCAARVGKLRGAGNAIVPQVAATFIRAALGALEDGGIA